MTRKVILVHGRAQEGKDSGALKKEWLSYLHTGLAGIDRRVELADSQFRMPYYGDTLVQLAGGVNANDAAKVVVRGAMSEDPGYRSFAEAVVQEIVRSPASVALPVAPGNGAARGVLNWPWVLSCLRILDARSATIGDLSVSELTKDVYAYLTIPGIREVMDRGVIDAIGDESEPVIVSHSLGTVIAYNVLKNRPGIKAPLFVTLGSPLGVGAIKRRIAPLLFPDGVARWINAYDPNDVVSLFPLDANFIDGSSIENDAGVINTTENRHGIAGYLTHAPVAEAIFRAMGSGKG